MQKYRVDVATPQEDGSFVGKSQWMGGEPIALVRNCRLVTLAGDMRRTVYATGEHDTFFSVPAACRIMGCRVNGYLTTDDDGIIVFRHTYY